MVNYPISRDSRVCHFCSYNVVEIEAHFVLESPLYNSVRDKSRSLFVVRKVNDWFDVSYCTSLLSCPLGIRGQN